MVNIAWIIFILIIVVIVFFTVVRMVKEYERIVIFQLGRYKGVKGPGLFIIIPFMQKGTVVDLRTQVIDIPRQEAIPQDNVPTIVNAAVFYKVSDPGKSIIRVENFKYAVSQVAQTTLRSVIGSVTLDELLSHRQKINDEVLHHLDAASEEWGVNIEAVELKDLELPDNMKRAMAKQAESERERRSRVILAEGELQASEKLSQAAAMMSESGGISLRFLQTLQEISTENSSTVIIPFPAEFSSLAHAIGALATKEADKK